MKCGTGWDLGPLLQDLHLDKCLLQQQIQRNYEGLKITAGLRRGQIINHKIQKGHKPNCHFWGVGGKSRVLCRIPAHTSPRGRADHLSPPSGRTPGPASTLTPFKGAACPPRGAARAPVTCSRCLCCRTSPSQASPELLIWPPIKFYCLKSPRTLVGNKSRVRRNPNHQSYF